MNKELITGHRLKQLRMERKLTQKEVCHRLNLGINTVRCNEKGMVPNTPQLCKYADFYNVSTDYLLGRTSVRNHDMDINAKNLAHLENIKNEVLIMLGKR